jgi:hypothetical protein
MHIQLLEGRRNVTNNGLCMLLHACFEVPHRLPGVGDSGDVHTLPMQGLLQFTHELMGQPCVQIVPVRCDGPGALLLSWRVASLSRRHMCQKTSSANKWQESVLLLLVSAATLL